MSENALSDSDQSDDPPRPSSTRSPFEHDGNISSDYISSGLGKRLKAIWAEMNNEIDVEKIIGPERTLDRFKDIELKGVGGQAYVFKARDSVLLRPVIIKMYKKNLSEEAKQRILDEGQALARVQSPFVARCYNFEENGENPYLILELVAGKTLKDFIEEQHVSNTEALRIACDVAEGIRDVHETGLIHLDLKPTNVIIDDKRQIKIVDFGLATETGDVDEGLIGTLSFMSPECANKRQDSISKSTDVFGIGAIYYFLLTGQKIYNGSSRREVHEMAKNSQFIEPSKLISISQAENRLCMDCLNADQSKRIASANEFLARAKGIGRRRVFNRIAAAVLAISALVMTFWLLTPKPTGVDYPEFHLAFEQPTPEAELKLIPAAKLIGKPEVLKSGVGDSTCWKLDGSTGIQMKAPPIRDNGMTISCQLKIPNSFEEIHRSDRTRRVIYHREDEFTVFSMTLIDLNLRVDLRRKSDNKKSNLFYHLGHELPYSWFVYSVVVDRKNDKMILSLDGMSVKETEILKFDSNAGSAFIGFARELPSFGNPINKTEGWTGLIDDFRIYNQPLSLQEINSIPPNLENQEHFAMASDLKLEWKFNGLIATWNDNSTQERGYKIFRHQRGVPGGKILVAKKQANATQTYISQDDLPAGKYTYSIETTFGNRSYFSDTASTDKPIGTSASEGIPENLSAKYVPEKGGVVFTWKDNSEDETEYVVIRKKDGEPAKNWPKHASLEPNSTEFVDKDVSAGQVYQYNIICNFESGFLQASRAVEIRIPLDAGPSSTNPESN